MRANRESYGNQEKSSSTPFFFAFQPFAILAATNHCPADLAFGPFQFALRVQYHKPMIF
jgi:hypothetical protein